MPTVVIPWRGGCVHRERALGWALRRYADRHPEWETLVAELADGPWVKARAVAGALKLCDEVVIVADADVWTDGLATAVEAVEAGASWAIPHRMVYRLDEESTAALLNGGGPRAYARRPYQGVAGGGYVVTHREILTAVPFDARYQGWGQEDESLALALWCLVGPYWRGDADLVHLWHPPAARRHHRVGSLASGNLHKRYISVRNDPAGMRRLIGEARECLSS